MRKYLALILSLILITVCFAGCSGGNSSSDAENDQKQAAVSVDRSDVVEEEPTTGTVFLNSTRKGAITKAASPIVGIKFNDEERFYDISKTGTNFKVQPVSGNSEPFYVMFDSPDEVVIGDFAYGFATAISTKLEDLIHIYDFEKNTVYKIVTPLNSSNIKKLSADKYAVQYTTTEGKQKTISFSTAEKYAYDLFISTKDVVMIIDGGDKYDEAKELAGTTEGATTVIEEGNTVVQTETTANNSLKRVTETTTTSKSDGEAEIKVQTERNTEEVEEAEAGSASKLEEKRASGEADKDIAEDDTETTEEIIVVEETYYIINDEELANEEPIVAVDDNKKDIEGGVLIDAPIICQFPHYPTGCESVSATMALNYNGINISVDDFINDYLDKDNNFYIENGKRIGPSPHEFFIGSPYDESGFGCLANVIYNALLKIYSGDTTKVVNVSGLSMDELCVDYINKGIPAIVWANISMTDSFESNAWSFADGTEFVWKSGEHCMLLVGYDANNYYFNDPYTGELVNYPKGVSENCYEQQGMQAVVIIN